MESPPCISLEFWFLVYIYTHFSTMCEVTLPRKVSKSIISLGTEIPGSFVLCSLNTICKSESIELNLVHTITNACILIRARNMTKM